MKWWILAGSALLVLLVVAGGIFYATGGRGLVRIIPKYLMADIPDKQYSWSDFVPSNATKRVSGFYSAALSNDESFAIWTLSGLKRFYHLADTSAYYHRDTCGIWQELEAARVQGGQAPDQLMRPNEPDVLFRLSSWQEEMQQEYFVTVQWLEQEGRRYVDKAWSVSGKYSVLGRVGASACE